MRKLDFISFNHVRVYNRINRDVSIKL